MQCIRKLYLALEGLVPVGLLHMSDGLSLEDLLSTVVAPLAGPGRPLCRPVEALVVPPHVLRPLQPTAGRERHVAAATGQLQLARNLDKSAVTHHLKIEWCLTLVVDGSSSTT